MSKKNDSFGFFVILLDGMNREIGSRFRADHAQAAAAIMLAHDCRMRRNLGFSGQVKTTCSVANLVRLMGPESRVT